MSLTGTEKMNVALFFPECFENLWGKKPKQRKETASAAREHMLSAALAFEIISTSVESVTCCSATA